MAVLAQVLAVGLLTAGPASALDLPTPAGQRESDRVLLQQVGARPDRILTSRVPGPVVNDEVVLVDLDGAGAPARVRLEQRLTLTGTGDYQVRERGPGPLGGTALGPPAPRDEVRRGRLAGLLPRPARAGRPADAGRGAGGRAPAAAGPDRRRAGAARRHGRARHGPRCA